MKVLRVSTRSCNDGRSEWNWSCFPCVIGLTMTRSGWDMERFYKKICIGFIMKYSETQL
jgi:hypothetical protein